MRRGLAGGGKKCCFSLPFPQIAVSGKHLPAVSLGGGALTPARDGAPRTPRAGAGGFGRERFPGGGVWGAGQGRPPRPGLDQRALGIPNTAVVPREHAALRVADCRDAREPRDRVPGRACRWGRSARAAARRTSGHAVPFSRGCSGGGLEASVLPTRDQGAQSSEGLFKREVVASCRAERCSHK